MRMVKAYLEPVFLYNSELWTLTKKLEKEVDIFQRKILKSIFHICWQDRISNEELYQMLNTSPWSHIIQERRLRWYGHLNRLPEEAPAKQALKEAKRQVKKLKGGQKHTWIKLIKEDLKKIKLSEEEAQILAQDRKEWRSYVHRGMSVPTDGNR